MTPCRRVRNDQLTTLKQHGGRRRRPSGLWSICVSGDRCGDVVMFGLVVETLVVIMDRDREHLLGVILTDDIIVKNFAYFLRGRNAVARLHQRGLVLLADDVHAQFDALVADENGRAGDELAHLMLALAAERAMERFLGFAAADLAHLRTPTRCESSQSLPCRPNHGHVAVLSPCSKCTDVASPPD